MTHFYMARFHACDNVGASEKILESRKMKTRGIFVDEIAVVRSSTSLQWTDANLVSKEALARLELFNSHFNSHPGLRKHFKNAENPFWRTLVLNTLSFTDARYGWKRRGVVEQGLDIVERTFTDGSSSTAFFDFSEASRNLQWQSFFITRSGYIGAGPQNAQPGDKIYVLLGGRMLIIVRPEGKDDEVGGPYTFIGGT
ncbi:hypothetical protein BDY21DRAFT_109540 [Lineolata rhizophorae]|uniref:Uncharacterized protein n=1 Tax=Lineolata rhizophorae TaxID=578093 RepID=A0A6A6NR83_9PEZI|nr:hypothetical protein BDY21DRAFT_109540 [Lineolata rhizophorae]